MRKREREQRRKRDMYERRKDTSRLTKYKKNDRKDDDAKYGLNVALAQ